MRAPDFWTRDSAFAKASAALLAPAGALYGLSVRARRASARPFRPRARVLCVGNLTAGGTGKTPIAIALGRMLTARGQQIVFLTRGYGGRSRGPVVVDPTRHNAGEVGDEALLLAAQATTIVARNRADGARLADSLGTNVIVMDDGFQNFQIAKDLSLVAVDAGVGFGNGRLIPAGPLREPIAQGLSRTDALVLMGDGTPRLPAFDGPVLRAQLSPSAPKALHGRSLFAFAGIGRPEKFFQTLRAFGGIVIAAQSFPDHHPFTASELTKLKSTAQAARALLVTTEKDYVRLDSGLRQNVLPVAVHAVFTDEDAVTRLLDRLMPSSNVQTQ
jgi:tetraacyldisaccharide 4'-kinase